MLYSTSRTQSPYGLEDSISESTTHTEYSDSTTDSFPDKKRSVFRCLAAVAFQLFYSLYSIKYLNSLS